jgi:hypothetical protein
MNEFEAALMEMGLELLLDNKKTQLVENKKLQL